MTVSTGPPYHDKILTSLTFSPYLTYLTDRCQVAHRPHHSRKCDKRSKPSAQAGVLRPCHTIDKRLCFRTAHRSRACKYTADESITFRHKNKRMISPRLIAKIESEEPANRLAVLIDADNAQAAVIEGLLAEIARFGEATVKRIYGDFTSPNSSSWKKVLQKYSIKPVQQFAYTTGKNATDSTLIIDAMDLLYTRKFDGFCLVTSDSDFTGLAVRIREEGLRVFGFGEQKTPEAFRNACHKFIFTEVLRPAPSTEATTATPKSEQSSTQQKPAEAKTPPVEFPKDFVLDALEKSYDETGWAHLGTFGSYLTKLQPDFDSRLFGFKKLSDLVKARTDIFLTEERALPGQTQKVLYVRAK